MTPQTASSSLLTVAFLVPLLASCGDALDDDAPAVPAEPVEIADYQRDVPSIEEQESEVDTADCNADLAAPFVGQEAGLETRTSLLEAVAPIVNVRWIEPGQATNDDLVPQRLNVRIDEEGVISSLECG